MISLYDILEGANGQLFGEPAGQLFADFCFDSRRAQESYFFVALAADQNDGGSSVAEAIANGATGVLCTAPPDMDTTGVSVVLVRDTQTGIMGWVRHILSKYSPHIIAVSGASGKSLTAEAVHRVLSTRFPTHYQPTQISGRLSLPLGLAGLSAEHEFVVLELDAAQPGEMAAMLALIQPESAIITHIGHSEADPFGATGQSAEEHRLLIDRLPPQGVAVLNFDRDDVRMMGSGIAARVLTIGQDSFGADLMAYNVVLSVAGTGFDLRHDQKRYVGRWTPLLGRYQLYCVLAALALGTHYGIAPVEGLRALQELAPLPGRMNPLVGVNGSLIVDDTYSADPETMMAALDWLREVSDAHHRAIFVMGDMDNLGARMHKGHRLVGQHAAQVAALFVTQGTDAAMAGRAALDAGMEARSVYVTFNTADTVARLRDDVTLMPDGIVLVKGSASAHMESVVAALLADDADRQRLVQRGGGEESSITFAESTRPSWVEVDLDALASNVRGLKRLVGADVTLTAVVKADAYGAGAVAVARTALLNGAGYLAVSSIYEAMELRDAGIEAPILILSYVPPAEIRQAVRHRIAVTLYDLDLARAYHRAALEAGGRLIAHIKVDTGMGRLGVMPAQAMAFFRHVMQMDGVEIEGLYTHFAAADDDPELTNEQLRVFRSVVKPLRASGVELKYIHAANSAATLAFPEAHFNMVRVGLAMHGLSPSETVRVPADFRPVLAWKTAVAQVKTLPPNHGVGYGHTYHTSGEERIAILPVGYADGFRRAPANWGHVLIHGQFAPLVGRVSMEKSAVNVTHIADVVVGDEVVLLGAQGEQRIHADDVAVRLGTVSYEVLCSVLPRVPRR